MNLIILTYESFPYGMAGTNRIISYSKYIANSKNSVKVICLKPTDREDNIVNTKIKGEYNNIKYEYSSGTTILPLRGKKKIKKIYYIVKGLINAVKIIKNSKTKVDCLLLYSNSNLNILFFYFISRFLKIPYIQEKSEYPMILRKNTIISNIFSDFYINIIFKLFDGAIIETNKLIDYYKPKFKKDAKIICVPMTVELERFNLKPNKAIESYLDITYCGNMSEYDGISILIDSFNILAKKYDNIKLTLIGDTSNKVRYKELINKISNLKLTEKIIFTGKLERDEVPRYLCEPSILVLASPISMRSTGSVPCKLGEYLATGNPVVVTNVGEISDYLKDEVSAFLAVPNDVNSFTKKLEYVILNPVLAKKVGIKGKEIASKFFNSKVQADRIIKYIDRF